MALNNVLKEVKRIKGSKCGAAREEKLTTAFCTIDSVVHRKQKFNERQVARGDDGCEVMLMKTDDSCDLGKTKFLSTSKCLCFKKCEV